MENITLYLWDACGVLTGTVDQLQTDFVPPQSTPTAPPEIPSGLVAIWIGGGGGAAEDPGELPAPPTPVPFSVSSRQGKLALLGAGFLGQAEAMTEAIPDPIEKKAQIEWGATDWERGNAFLQGTWALLGGTPAQLDDLFRLPITL